MIATDLRKQQTQNADPEAIQQISFTGNLDQNWIITMFFIIEEVKETILDFHKELWEYCKFISL